MAKINKFILDKLKSSSRNEMEEAFNIVYNEYSYLVYYISFKILNDSELAKDITNETFMKFFENRNNINCNKNVKYYLTITSKNLSLNLKEKQSKVTQMTDEGFYEIKKNYFNEYINKFKDFLDEYEIELIILHLLYDFKFKEIASYYKMTTSSISSKYRRALHKVKQYYKGEKT